MSVVLTVQKMHADALMCIEVVDDMLASKDHAAAVRRFKQAEPAILEASERWLDYAIEPLFVRVEGALIDGSDTDMLPGLPSAGIYSQTWHHFALDVGLDMASPSKATKTRIQQVRRGWLGWAHYNARLTREATRAIRILQVDDTPRAPKRERDNWLCSLKRRNPRLTAEDAESLQHNSVEFSGDWEPVGYEMIRKIWKRHNLTGKRGRPKAM